LVFSPTGSINLGFTTEGRLADVLIITFSWGFQLGGYIKNSYINTAPPIADEHTRKGARGELMHNSGGCTGIAATAKDVEIVVGGRCAKEKVVWCILPVGATRPDVNESGGGECIRPKAWWHVGMEQECADAIIEGAEDVFSMAILLRRVGTRETEDSAMSSEKSANNEVVKLFAVIGLEGMDGSTELGGDVGEKGC
jgi:hypothetical protein